MLKSLGLLRPSNLEHALTVRCVILAAMLMPLLALGRVEARLWPHIFITGIAIVVGHWFSYRHLEGGGWLVRAFLFVGIHVVLCWLFIGLVVGATVPQAQFALFTQAITSFDLRYRSSLFNTLLHSFAIMYVAASFSRTLELALYLIIFVGLVLAAFHIAERDSGLKNATIQPLTPRNRRPVTLFSLSFGLLAIVAMAGVFILLPRFTNNPIVPPFSFDVPLQGGTTSEIVNPGVPLVQINGWSDQSGDYFYGFDTNLDLRYRGGLSDEIVMYVRSPSRSYWRSHSYDFYTGVMWQQSDKSVEEIERFGGVYFEFEPPPGSPARAETPREPERIVQTFNIIREQPNLVFAAYRPAELFIRAETVSLDAAGGIRVPERLQPGMTYSVISYRPNFDPAQLRQEAAGPYPRDIAARYLQLPDNISDRVRNLARDLTAPYDNTFDKVNALNEHLLTEYPYNFFPPPHPPGAEVVDTFLFVDKEGICEQYVTALVVMARSLGIPARLVAGYGSGDYNPITNYYEVRLNHAHSWAEVYFPETGWVPFDPTPGWTPQPYPTPLQNWLFANSGDYLGFNLANAPVGQFIAAGFGWIMYAIPVILGLAVLVGLGFALYWLGRRIHWTPAGQDKYGYSLPDNHEARQAILRLYQRGLALTRRRYDQRAASETLSEYARKAPGLTGLSRLTHATEIAAYRPTAPDETLIDEAQDALDHLGQELRRKT